MKLKKINKLLHNLHPPCGYIIFLLLYSITARYKNRVEDISMNHFLISWAKFGNMWKSVKYSTLSNARAVGHNTLL